MCRKKKRVKYLIISPSLITKTIWRTPKNAEEYLKWKLKEYGYAIERCTEERPNFMGS
jgi:hypothetical protein